MFNFFYAIYSNYPSKSRKNFLITYKFIKLNYFLSTLFVLQIFYSELAK